MRILCALVLEAVRDGLTHTRNLFIWLRRLPSCCSDIIVGLQWLIVLSGGSGDVIHATREKVHEAPSDAH